MDAAIAEHVFGWRKVHGPKSDFDGPCESFDVLVPSDIDNPFPLYPPRGTIKPWYFCKKWSTDISAAWEVLEHIRSKGICFDIVTFEDFYEVFRGEERLASVPSITEAICKAAILAVMECDT